MRNLFKSIFQLCVCLIILSSCNRNADLINRELRLEGRWNYSEAVERGPNGFFVSDISGAFQADYLEFSLPDKVIYFDSETNSTWSGIWQLERFNTTDESDREYILTISLLNPDNQELTQQTLNLRRLNQNRLVMLDQQRDKSFKYWLDRN